MKVIAYYLPQFHRTRENDIWWGEGFTEWTHVKSGVPLFKGHYQPHVPFDGNYYSLNEKTTVEVQTALMHKYGVYGFAYYHYWFDGDLLLEMPAENLLNWQDIDQRFFLFWANHSWVKSVEGRKTILKEQTYGGERDWAKHFEYLAKFFGDSRYIRVGDRPVIGIYNVADIPDYCEMLAFWNRLAVEAGFPGIYTIQSVNNLSEATSVPACSDALTLRMPNLATNETSKWYSRFKARPALQRLVPLYYPYKSKYSKIISIVNKINEGFSASRKVFYGTYTGWDNTPRHGRRGSVHTDSDPALFKDSLVRISKLCTQDDFVFINAWNEWAEGMHLEPDDKCGYSFLQAVLDAQAASFQ